MLFSYSVSAPLVDQTEIKSFINRLFLDTSGILQFPNAQNHLTMHQSPAKNSQ